MSDEARAKGGTSAATKAFASAGLVAAMILAVLVNVLVARHYKRWDLTTGGRFTLSEATLETLRALDEPVHIYVLTPSSSPITGSIARLLESYRAETTKVEVEFADPDAKPAQFLAIQQKYGVLVGRTDEGESVTDAAILVVRGDKPFFLTLHDLVEVDEDDDTRATPKIEEALTTAIRSVLGGEKLVACFTTGHGEKQGVLALRERLTKNNFEVRDLPPVASLEGADPLVQCSLLIVAGPTEHVPDDDIARWKQFVSSGGSVFVGAGPYPDGQMKRFKELGLDPLLAMFGIKLDKDFVFELDPKRHLAGDFGEVFLPEPAPHPITQPLIKAKNAGLDVQLTIASSLSALGGDVAPQPLLVTTDKAFGMVDFFSWSNESAPRATAADKRGPLTVGFASEIPKKASAKGDHGPRMVAVGSMSVFSNENWQKEQLRGTSLFVEDSISWLTARPSIVDVPPKPSFTAAIRVTEDQLTSIFRYVVVFIPLAIVLLGAAVYVRRRDGKPARAGGR